MKPTPKQTPRGFLKTAKTIHEELKAIVDSNRPDLVSHLTAYVVRERNRLWKEFRGMASKS